MHNQYMISIAINGDPLRLHVQHISWYSLYYDNVVLLSKLGVGLHMKTCQQATWIMISILDFDLGANLILKSKIMIFGHNKRKMRGNCDHKGFYLGNDQVELSYEYNTLRLISLTWLLWAFK